MADTTDMSGLPAYEDFGFRSCYPGPFLCSRGDMRMLLLKGDMKKIEALVERTLNVPANGAMTFRPIFDHVIYLQGLNVVESMDPDFQKYGKVDEVLAAFFVPLLAGRMRDGAFDAQAYAMTIPFIIVDNAMSLAGGREIFGFNKALGQFEPKGEYLKVRGYGGPWRPDSTADWFPLLSTGPAERRTLEGTDEDPESTETREGLGAFLDVLDEQLRGEVSAAGIPAVVRRELCRFLKEGRKVDQVYLKQFRDVTDHRLAAFQRVVTAPMRIRSMKLRELGRRWDFAIEALDSHPLTEELGIESGPAAFSMRLTDFEFEVLPGREIGRRA